MICPVELKCFPKVKHQVYEILIISRCHEVINAGEQAWIYFLNPVQARHDHFSSYTARLASNELFNFSVDLPFEIHEKLIALHALFFFLIVEFARMKIRKVWNESREFARTTEVFQLAHQSSDVKRRQS